MISNSSQKDELAVVKEDLENLDRYTKDLRKKHKKLEEDYEQLDTVRRNSKRDHEELDARHRELENIHEVAMIKIKALEAEVTSNNTHILALNTQLKAQQPLLQIGGDIRLRFMEQAKGHGVKDSKTHVQSPALKFGNQAAHSGNGQADAAVIALGMFAVCFSVVMAYF
jgi:chromosome segregation ATPase